MTRSDLLRLRLRGQHLTSAPLPAASDVVSRLGAVQSQDYPAAKWALAQRSIGEDDAVDAAFDAGAILRTHVMRPTWHFVSPADIRWLVQLTGPRVNALCAHYYRKMAIDSGTAAKANAVMEKALAGGRFLTRAELARALRRAGVIPAEESALRISFLVMHAELDGVICSGPRMGRQFTYALFDERVPPARPRTREEALAELVARYFVSHGPAAVKDFAWWSGLTVADTKAGLAAAARTLEQVEVDGTPYWMAPQLPEEIQSPGASLLPVYDEALLSYRDNRQAPAPLLALFRRDNGRAVVFGGRVIGTWRPTTTAKAVSVVVSSPDAVTARARRAIAATVERYGEFLGLASSVSFHR